MKIITISGSCSGAGKTTALRALLKKLPVNKAVTVKFGHGKSNPERPEILFSDMMEGLAFITDLSAKGKTEYLLIEGNSVLKYINPDVSVFIEGHCREKKKSAEQAKALADIVIL
ncbi:hypothetical protein JXL83_07225 [candidate division WOR-3 bacterium]|nr:hypothetical protein [candidate division WOR-3 bacterium]